MTLLLIVTIVFLIVWWKDSSDKKAKAEQYRQSTITNVELEREIEIEWLSIIDEKLKNYNGEYDAFEYLLTLFDEYEVPKIRWDDPEDFVEKKRDSAKKQFAELKKSFDLRKIEGFGVSPHITVIYADAASDSYPLVQRLQYIENPPIYDSQEKYKIKYIEYEDVKKKNHKWFTFRYIEIKATGLTAYNYIIASDAAFYMYSRLISLLTRKTLKSKGFHPSPDGKHESKWQEAEKTHNRLLEEDTKYPWLKV